MTALGCSVYVNSNNLKKNILVTGGAGFIGTNLVTALLQDERIEKVRVLDNLSTGYLKNIETHFTNPRFEFVEGDIRDFEQCLAACKDMHLLSHQAALGSVPRSINDPLTTNAVNISGFLNVFYAAKEGSVQKIVYAASSSTYGDNAILPKKEALIGKPLSPYAVTKYVNELYAQVFADLYQVSSIGLRYFNVFGPKQDPNGAYAAVIPLFIKAALTTQAPYINGDGSQTRDFTFVQNAVQANIKALFSETMGHEVVNIACGERTSLNRLWELISGITGSDLAPIYREGRPGDVKDSLADISKASRLIGYRPEYSLLAGLEQTVRWYREAASD